VPTPDALVDGRRGRQRDDPFPGSQHTHAERAIAPPTELDPAVTLRRNAQPHRVTRRSRDRPSVAYENQLVTGDARRHFQRLEHPLVERNEHGNKAKRTASRDDAGRASYGAGVRLPDDDPMAHGEGDSRVLRRELGKRGAVAVPKRSLQHRQRRERDRRPVGRVEPPYELDRREPDGRIDAQIRSLPLRPIRGE